MLSSIPSFDDNQQTPTAPASLREILALIDSETASARNFDIQLLKEQSLKNVRKKRRYIHFRIGSVDMAIAIESVLETGHLPEIVPLPHLPPWIRGVIQIRGEIVSVVDLALLYGLPRQQHDHFGQHSYLLFRYRDLQFCLFADQIRGTISIDEKFEKVVRYQAKAGDILENISPLFKGIVEEDARNIFILDHLKLGTAPQIRKWQ
jgi:purine-binding chemotaxis protein CheW